MAFIFLGGFAMLHSLQRQLLYFPSKAPASKSWAIRPWAGIAREAWQHDGLLSGQKCCFNR